MHPEPSRTLPGDERIAGRQLCPEVIALQFDSIGRLRHHREKVLPALLAPGAVQVQAEKAVGQGRPAAAFYKLLRIPGTDRAGAGAQAEIIEVERQRIVIETSPEPLIGGPAPAVDRPRASP